MYRHTSSSFYSEPSCTAALTTQQLRQSSYGYGLEERRESLDVGNKSDRSHRRRPNLIFFTDFMLKDYTVKRTECQHVSAARWVCL
ncbi:hypothetical protein ATANTOWER_021464 [Ataeniobius toweri]|uniref:Uncharacterized protein n=1 Tax=Ataeniobius toweri TaxID=208326 RepID=A0ABU7BEI4_9TELE|nr:hypothetical protein [Ataeniobius toweri]